MANTKILEAKQTIINEIKDKVNSSTSVVLFEYSNMTVADMTKLRRELKENNAELKVYKNTLAARAINDLKLDLGDNLNGPKAIAFGNDEISPIKILNTFAHTCPALQIKIGIVDGKVTSLEELKSLANVPSREALLTMLASGLLGTVRDLSICLDLHIKNMEENSH